MAVNGRLGVRPSRVILVSQLQRDPVPPMDLHMGIGGAEPGKRERPGGVPGRLGAGSGRAWIYIERPPARRRRMPPFTVLARISGPPAPMVAST